MDPNKAAMKAALRVLTALTEKQAPATQDVSELQAYVPQNSAALPLDELACEAIQQALRNRAETRHATAGN